MSQLQNTTGGASAEYWQQENHERYEAFRRFEEATDISERLSLSLETPIDFTVDDAGHVYSEFGDRFAEVIGRWVAVAQRRAEIEPENAFEAERAMLEEDEAYWIEALARGELDGNMLLIISPVPDAVRDGTATIGGYNRQRLRSMVRMYQADGARVRSTTISLDQSNMQGLRAVAAAFGDTEVPDDISSEQFLARRHVFTATDQEAEFLPALARSSYDEVLREQLGGTWYAGSRFATKQDALSYVQSQTSLFDEHMRAVDAVVAAVRDPKQRAPKLEALRQRAAAAIDAQLHGHVVESISDATVTTHQAQGDFSGDCPDNAGSTTQIIESMGMVSSDTLRCVTCPLPNCGKVVDAKITKEGIYCPACKGEALSDGSIIYHNQSAPGQRQLGVIAIFTLSLNEGRAHWRQKEQQRRERKAKQAALR